MGVWSINVNDPLEFCVALWNKSVEFIHRGVIFTSNNGITDCKWMDVTNTNIEYIDRFLAIYDVSQKRNILCSTVDGPKLHAFLSKDLK